MPRKPPAAGRLIRRYDNRKLYDTRERRYVVLGDLARMVGQGEDLRVEDQRTGEDLSAVVMAQVILEGVKERTTRIPGQVLARLIRLGFGSPGRRARWPEPGEAAAQARREAERIVAGLLARGRLTLEEGLAAGGRGPARPRGPRPTAPRWKRRRGPPLARRPAREAAVPRDAPGGAVRLPPTAGDERVPPQNQGAMR